MRKVHVPKLLQKHSKDISQRMMLYAIGNESPLISKGASEYGNAVIIATLKIQETRAEVPDESNIIDIGTVDSLDKTSPVEDTNSRVETPKLHTSPVALKGARIPSITYF